MRKSLRLAQRVGVATLALGLGGTVATATAAFAVTGNSPSAPTFSVQGSNLASTTIENLNLPTGAACAAAGNTGETYVSFLVPEGTDLTKLTFKNAPLADQGTALIDTNGNYLQQTNAENTPAGGIDPHYAFQLEFSELVDPNGGAYDVNAGTQLPSGNSLIPHGSSSAQYEAGVACISGGTATPPSTEDTYYSTPVTLNVASGDPHGFTVTIGGSGPVLPEAPLAVGLPVGGAAVLLGAAFINRRRRRTTPVAAG